MDDIVELLDKARRKIEAEIEANKKNGTANPAVIHLTLSALEATIRYWKRYLEKQ